MQLISLMRPAGGVLENVAGLRLAPDHEVPPLDVIRQELLSHGFATEVLEIDASSFLSITRKRLASHSMVASMTCLRSPMQTLECILSKHDRPTLAVVLPS